MRKRVEESHPNLPLKTLEFGRRAVCVKVSNDVPPLQTFESMHGLSHVWVGGFMFVIRVSPNDPSFYMHHAFVDSLWERYQLIPFHSFRWISSTDSVRSSRLAIRGKVNTQRWEKTPLKTIAENICLENMLKITRIGRADETIRDYKQRWTFE